VGHGARNGVCESIEKNALRRVFWWENREKGIVYKMAYISHFIVATPFYREKIAKTTRFV
jgi:hypothetical protein